MSSIQGEQIMQGETTVVAGRGRGRPSKYANDEERLEARRATALKYYYDNRNKMVQYSRDYHDDHREVLNQKKRDSRARIINN